MNILRPLSPHLPIYKPQLTSTFPISHRISEAFLATILFFFYLLCLKIGLICFTYENVYQWIFYSSKLILICKPVFGYLGMVYAMISIGVLGFLVWVRFRQKRSLTFDSYTIPEDDPELGQSRLLEVDNRVVVPEKTHLRSIVTSADVPHSWAVPSLGVKCDAVPYHFPRPMQYIVFFLLTFYLYGIPGGILAECDSLHAFSNPATPIYPEAQIPPEIQPPLAPEPAPIRIPQLERPLIAEEARRNILYTRYGMLNFGRNDNLTRMVNIIDLQAIVERSIEAALVDDGFHPNAIMVQYREIRGILHAPQGELLAPRTYQSYVTEIRERGTRQSVPYRRIIRAILRRDLVL